MHTFFKNGELDFTNVATAVSLTNVNKISNYQIIKYFECPICKLICKITRSICGSDLTKAAVEFALNQVCTLIAGPFQSTCDKIVHQSINQMADLITKFTDDAAVCKFVHFCTGDAEINKEIEMEPPNEIKRKFDCPICKAVVSGIKALVKSDYSENKIKDALTKVCSKLHKFGSKCQHFVDAYAQKLVGMLTNAATRGKVCKLLKLCPSFDSSVLADEKYTFVNDMEMGLVEVDKKKFDCSICKAVVSGIKALVKSDYSQNKIKDALTKVCSKLHKFGSKCQHFVDAYAGKLVELTNAATRGKVCRLIKLCAVDEANFIPEPYRVKNGFIEVNMEHVPQITGEEAHDFEEADKDIIAPELNDVTIGECLLCKGIVKAVKEIVKHSFTKDQVKRALSKACSKVHSNHCQSFVSKHFNQLVDLISNGSKRGKVCKLMLVCSTNPFVEVDFQNSSQNKQSFLANDQFLISNQDSVEIGSIEADIENTPQITQEQLVNFEFSNIEMVDKKKFDCTICKAVVSGIKALVKSDFSQNKIKDALTKVCSKLHKFGSKCQHFVDAYAGKLVELLTNAATRGKVCRLIKLCAVDDTDEENLIAEPYGVEKGFVEVMPKITLEEDKEMNFPELNDVQIGECLLCKGIVKAVKEIVKHSFTKDQVKRALSKACSKVHSNHCQSFVNKHFNQLVDLISNGSKRGKVCKLMLVCSTNPFVEVDFENRSQNKQSLLANDQFLISNQDSVEIGSIEAGIQNTPQITQEQLVNFEFSNIEMVDKKKFDCTICKAVVSGIKALVKSDFSQNKIKDALTKVCSKLHKFGSKCQHFVDAYAGKLVELLTNAATRGKVCRLIKLCAVDDTDEENLISEAYGVEKGFVEVMPKITLEEDKEMNFPELNDVQIGECLLCKGIVKAVKEIVKHSFTKDQVKRALSKACSKVHSNHCQSFVNKHFNQLVDLISNGSKRGKVCKLIMVCSTEPVLEVDLESNPQNEQSLLEDDEFLIFNQDSLEIGSVEGDMENVPQIIQEEFVDFEVSNFETVDKKKFECPICKAVVSGIKALVKSDFSQNKIKDSLTKVCSKLHKFGSKCQHFVDAYAGKLVELLTNAATRGKVCKLLKICAGDDADETNFITEQYEMEENYIEVEMGHVPQITLMEEEDRDINFPELNDVKIGECLLCKGIVKAVKEIVKHSFTKDQVKRALSKACSKVHSKHCQSFVNKHFNQLVDLISNGSKRGKVCKLIMVCSTNPLVEVDLEINPQKEQSLLADDETLISVPDSVEIGSVEADMENVPQITLKQLVDFEVSNFQMVDKKKIDCTICKAVVSGIKALVKSDFSQNKIKDALTKVCSKLHKFGSKCQHFVDTYAGKLVELLTNAATRGKVCRLIKLCAVNDTDEENFISELYGMEKGFVEVDMEQNPQITLEEEDKETNFPELNDVQIGECLLCKGIVKAVKEIVKHSFTKDQVKRALSKACSKVHSKHCQSFVNKHFNQLVDLISNGSKRGKVCKLIMVCSTNPLVEVDLEHSPQITQEQLADFEFSNIEMVDKKKFDCPICKAVVSGIKALVKSDFSQNKIKNALTKVCSKLHKVGSKCQHFVDAYAGKLVELLTNAATRGKVCRLIKLCSTHNIFSVEEFGTTKNIDECFACQTAVFGVVQIIKKDYTKDKVRHVLSALKEMCEVHKKQEPSCPKFLHLLNKYFDKLVELISNDKTRLKTCTILKLCDSKNTYDNLPNFDLHHIFINNLRTQNYGPEKDDECPICKKIIHHILEEVRRDVTKENIQHVINAFEHMCKADKSLWIYCPTLLKIVEKGSDKFASLISNKKTRNKACVILKLCPSEDIEDLDFSNICHTCKDIVFSAIEETNNDPEEMLSLLEQPNVSENFENRLSIKKNKVCNVCEIIVFQVIRLTKHDPTNKTKIEDALEEFQNWCQIRSEDPACATYIHILDKYFDKFVILIQDVKTQRKTCNILKLCPGNQVVEQPLEINAIGDVQFGECLICKAVVKIVEEVVKHSRTREHIKKALEEACHKIHFRHCERFVKKHMNQLLELILKATRTDKICHLIKICSIRPPKDDWSELESSISENSVFKQVHDECFLCQATVFGVVQIVKKDFTKDRIRHVLTALKLMCEVHKKDERDCPKFLILINKYFDKLVDLIADEKTRFKVCSILKICSTAAGDFLNFLDQDLEQSFVANLLKQNTQIVKQSLEQDLEHYEISPCQSCQYAVSMMKTFAQNPHIVALVHEQLTKLCDLVLVSPQLRNICHNQINVHWASLLNMIRQLQENRICHTVKLCSTPNEELRKYDVAKVGTNMCNMCQMSLSLMKSLAQNIHFAALLHDTLDNGCNLLVSPFIINMCHSELRTHWLTWLGILRNFQEARVCQTIKMCHAVQIYGDNAKGERCESCKAISHLLKFMFKQPNFKTRIHSAVNQMCDMLSPAFRSICHAEVNINWQKWMTLLQAIPDEKLCHKVDMCP